MRKFLTILLIILLLAAAVTTVYVLKNGRPAATVEPTYDEELYRQFREAEIKGDYVAMNAAYDENMTKTGVSFLTEDYDPTHGGLIYTYDYSVSDDTEDEISGKLYIIGDGLDRNAQAAGENDYFVLDRRTGVSDPEFVVYDSYRAESEALMRALCQVLLDHEAAHPTDWERTMDSMVSEWSMHNLSYNLGYKVDHSQHVNLNNADEGVDWLKRAMEEFK